LSIDRRRGSSYFLLKLTAARDKNAEAVKELDAIAAEIAELNGDVNGIYSAVKALL
jgi:hypothetical protein